MLRLGQIRGFSSGKSVLKQALLSTLWELSQLAKEGDSVVARGHVRTTRPMKNASFVDISDGASSGSTSVVFPGKDSLMGHSLKVGQSVEISGQWQRLAVKNDVIELVCNPGHSGHWVRILGDVPPRFPIQKKATSLEFLRTLPTLRHRTNTLGEILRARSDIEAYLGHFFHSQQFTKVAPPEISSSDCEGAGELFTVKSSSRPDFFKKDVYLTVSTQMHLEVLSAALNRVWTLTPCFRAENSDTNRHLSEFWMLEAEINYVELVEQLTTFCEQMLKAVASGLGAQIEEGSRVLPRATKERVQVFLREDKWPLITYMEALTILNEHNPIAKKNKPLQFGATITTEYEKWLADYYNGPLFITDYPKTQKPFYMKRSTVFDASQPTVGCFDLILPDVGELIGGSLRIDSYDELLEELKLRNMDKSGLEWYLSLRKNGTLPHGGFGMGFERLVMYLTGVENIRDVSAFPRAPGSCHC